MSEAPCNIHATEIALLKQGTATLERNQLSMSDKLEQLDKKVTQGFEAIKLDMANIKNDMRWWLLIGGAIVSALPSVIQYLISAITK